MAQHEHNEFRFKVTSLCCCIALASVIFSPLSAESAIQGDINNDGSIDTSEAIYALQVAAGLYPSVSTSCLLSGKGNWSPNTEYVECDVVSSGGENYVCNTSHTSLPGEFDNDITNWDLLSLKGEPGTSAWTDGIEAVTTTGTVGIGSATPSAKLDVNGGIKIANDNSTCDSSKAGVIRWSGSSFEGCNGSKWQLLSPVPTVYSSGHEWMDRNLGASRVAESSDDSEAYGDLYQWGRFSDGHEKRNSTAIIAQSDGNVPNHGNFITGYSDWTNSPNDELWQDSGLNNPCPAGFRIPTKEEMEAEVQSWTSAGSAGAYASPLKLVTAGTRWGSDGSVNDEGDNGRYLTTTLGGDVPYYLNFFDTGGYVTASSSTRSIGGSIRCLKD